MNSLQTNNIIPLYVVIACLIMFMDFVFPAAIITYYFKFFISLSLFLISLSQKKIFKEQKLMFTAQLFVVMADYFFVFTKALNGGQLIPNYKILGTVCFLIAYLILSKVWSKHRINKGNPIEIIIGLIILGLFWPTVSVIGPHLQISMKLGALVFGIILCYLTWTGICTRFRYYYGKQTSSLIGQASCLIFLSDIAVAHASLNPVFSGRFVPWLSALIWITYIPAWAIIVTIISSRNIYN